MHIAEEDQLLNVPFGCQDYAVFPTINPIEENRIGVRTNSGDLCDQVEWNH